MDDGGDSMDFTPRMQQILQRLLSETDFVSEQTLANDLGISKRTVQRELDGKHSDCPSGLRKTDFRVTSQIP